MSNILERQTSWVSDFWVFYPGTGIPRLRFHGPALLTVWVGIFPCIAPGGQRLEFRVQDLSFRVEGSGKFRLLAYKV